MLARFIYFLAIGWWLGLLTIALGSLLCATIIGFPLGLMVLNRLPTVVFLREPGEECEWGYPHRHLEEEFPILLRALWFFVIGCSLGFAAITVGYVLVFTIIGIPLGIYVLNRVPLLMTLSRHYS